MMPAWRKLQGAASLYLRKMEQDTTSASERKIVILGVSYRGVSTVHYMLKADVPLSPIRRTMSLLSVPH